MKIHQQQHLNGPYGVMMTIFQYWEDFSCFLLQANNNVADNDKNDGNEVECLEWFFSFV